jgi:hypothetical protein
MLAGMLAPVHGTAPPMTPVPNVSAWLVALLVVGQLSMLARDGVSMLARDGASDRELTALMSLSSRIELLEQRAPADAAPAAAYFL